MDLFFWEGNIDLYIHFPALIRPQLDSVFIVSFPLSFHQFLFNTQSGGWGGFIWFLGDREDVWISH